MPLGLWPPAALKGRTMRASLKSSHARRRLPLALFLAGAIGLAMLVSLGLVLWLTLGTARDNTLALLRDKAQLVLTLVQARTDQFLAPAEALTAEVARRIAQGEIDPADQRRLVDALGYAMAAAPQLNAAVYVDPSGWLLSIYRKTDGTFGWDREDWSADPVIVEAVREMGEDDWRDGRWGEPFYSAGAGSTLVYFAHPVRMAGALGFVVATATIRDLSAFIASIDAPGQIGAFILYGRDRVIAHAALATTGPLGSTAEPLPTIGDLGDPSLNLIWKPGWEERRIVELETAAHWVEGPVDSFVYLYSSLNERRDVPWIIGGYFRAEDIGQEWLRVNQATLIAGLLTLASLIGAMLLGRRLAQPASEIASHARAVSRLELDALQPLGGSRIRELDDAERALNSLVAALRCYIRYLPGDLAHYVIANPERDIGRPTLRRMTIMFTDISGFTALAETLDPEAVGAFLNRHFADLEVCIRATGGVIDKYLGDGLLAFWGAPEPMVDHEARALRAALDIAQTVRLRNGEAARTLRVRIGIASGDILVGDLGAPTRTNYTVIGDTVNLAERLLEIGHAVAPMHETVIVTTISLIETIPKGQRPSVRPLGEHHVRGRHGAVDVVEVRGPAEVPPRLD